MSSSYDLKPSIFGKFFTYVFFTFLPFVGSFCVGLFGRKLGFIGSSNATINCFLWVALLLWFIFIFFIWNLYGAKKTDCKLLTLYAPANTQRTTGAVFAFLYLLGHFLCLFVGLLVFVFVVVFVFVGVRFYGYLRRIYSCRSKRTRLFVLRCWWEWFWVCTARYSRQVARVWCWFLSGCRDCSAGRSGSSSLCASG